MQLQRENYDSPAISTGLTIGSIMSDFERQVIANRKRVLLNAVKAYDFRAAVYNQLEAYNKANAAAAHLALTEAGSYAEKEIERAYNEGRYRVEANIKEYARQGYKATLSSKKYSNLLSASIASTMSGLAAALFVGRLSANQQLLQITSLVNTSADNLMYEIDKVQAIFLQKGIKGSNNRNGVEIGIASAAELQMRTDSHETLLKAQGERSEEYGVYLIQISAHPSSCPLCLPWQSKVLVDDVYKDGKTDGKHELLSTAIGAGLFHYNCRHSYIIYVPGYSRDNIFDYDKASNKKTAQRYALEQEQRYNERHIREWKRKEAGALTQSEQSRARNGVLKWQANQRALEKYAEEQRIPFYRQYQRESIGGATEPEEVLATLERRVSGNSINTRVLTMQNVAPSTSTGINITGVKYHAEMRQTSRRITIMEINEALTNPKAEIVIKNKGIRGRESINFVYNKIEVCVNLSGEVVTVWSETKRD